MKNHLQEGATLEFTAGADLVAGQGLLVGTIFGVVAETVASGGTGVLITEGVFELDKPQALDVAIGDALYWDVADDEFNKTASGNWYAGKAWAAAGTSTTKVKVKINPGGAAAAGA